MNSLIIVYSLIKSIYEEKKDYLDVFVPFLLSSFPDGQRECGLDILSRNLEHKFGLNVPEFTLSTLITRAVRRNYVERKGKRCFLTEDGYRLASKIISQEKDEERKVIALIADIKSFIANKYQVELDSDIILGLINNFIKRHQSSLANFFSPKTSQENWQEKFDKQEFYLIEYFKLAKERKPDAFDTLEKIFYGSIISTLLLKENMSEINKNFNTVQTFFDTNFMFSILNLHYPYICKPAKELFELLKSDKKFQLKVFDFTIQEMIRVLNGYTKESYKYFPHIKVDSIYGALKSRGWTREDCMRFISKVEQRIYDLGINIEYTGIDLHKWQIPDNESYSRITNYKPDQILLSQKHDIYAIEKIREIRKRPKREIENCDAFFLTSDLRLAKFNFNELGHKENATIPEVISDRFLTTLLWLKNPNIIKELPLEIILSTQSELLIDRNVWNRFYDNLIKLKNEGTVSEEDISTLLYYHQLEQDLASVTNTEEISPEFILKEIEESKRKIDEEIRKKIEEEKKKLEKEYRMKMADKDREYLGLKHIKDKIRENSWRKASKYTNLVIIVFFIFLIIVGILLFAEFKIQAVKIAGGILSTGSFILTLLQFLGVQMPISPLKKRITDWFFNRIYKKQLIELEIEEDKDEIS
jgi:hypothetical protein